MGRHEYDTPTVAFRSPRAVALLHPFQLPLVLGLVVLATVFTVWPAALSHVPISFETRGIVHHIWHYTMFAGALLATYGMVAISRRRLQIELAGLALVIGALAMNLVARISEWAIGPEDEAPNGLGLMLRIVVIVGLLVRAYTIAREPTVQVPTRLNEGR